jgi:hypothetical protein
LRSGTIRVIDPRVSLQRLADIIEKVHCPGETHGPRVKADGPRVKAGGPHVEAGRPRVKAASPHVKAGRPRVRAGGPRVRAGGPRVKAGGPHVKAHGLHVKANGPHMKAGGPHVKAGGPHVKAGGPHVKAAVSCALPKCNLMCQRSLAIFPSLKGGQPPESDGAGARESPCSLAANGLRHVPEGACFRSSCGSRATLLLPRAPEVCARTHRGETSTGRTVQRAFQPVDRLHSSTGVVVPTGQRPR